MLVSAVGQGPERAMWGNLITKITENHQFWERRGQYFTPVLTPGSESMPHRQAQWKAFGFIFALHMLHTAQAPTLISPFLILCLIMRTDALLLPHEYIASVDKYASNKLAPWFELGVGDAIPTDHLHPLSQLFISEVNTQVCDFTP